MSVSPRTIPSHLNEIFTSAWYLQRKLIMSLCNDSRSPNLVHTTSTSDSQLPPDQWMLTNLNSQFPRNVRRWKGRRQLTHVRWQHEGPGYTRVTRVVIGLHADFSDSCHCVAYVARFLLSPRSGPEILTSPALPGIIINVPHQIPFL